MRALTAALTLAGLAACSPGPRVHSDEQFASCQNEMHLGDRAAACSAVIDDESADPQRRAIALVQRGTLRADSGQSGRAVADFGRALRLDPTQVEALVQRGIIHSDRGAYDFALRDFDAVLAVAPDNQVAAAERLTAIDRRGSAYSTQIAQLSQALVRDPNNPELLNNRCWLRATAGRDLELALADCNVALIQRPDYAAALDSRGLVHIKRGAHAEALADYEAALAIEPGRGHYLYGRGLARRALGQTAEGDIDLVAAEAAEPGVTRLYRSYGL